MEVRKLYIKFAAVAIVNDIKYNLRKLYIYDDKGGILNGKREIEVKYHNIAELAFKFNKDYKAMFRRTKNYERGEVFLMKVKGLNEYEVYIPASLIDLKRGDRVQDIRGGYLYKYDTYTFNGCELEKFSLFTENEIDRDYDDIIRYYDMVECQMTEETKKFYQLVAEIEETCRVKVDTWAFGRILEHYKIEKK